MTDHVIIFDIETDGYKPARIWCIGLYDYKSGQYEIYVEDELEAAYQHLMQANYLVGHNIKSYDCPAIERILSKPVFDRSKCIDTLELSRALFPEAKSHSLATWGQTLGYPKGDHTDFSKPSPEMYEYCLLDVEVTKKLFELLLEGVSNAE